MEPARNHEDVVGRERERSASIIARQRREIDLLLSERRRLRDEVDYLQRKLDQVYDSTTWKLGDKLLSLPKAIKDTFRGRRSTGASIRDALTFRTSVKPSALRMDIEITEDDQARSRYEDALKRRSFDPEGVRLAFLVSTIDLDEGRGDLYVAVGLGMAMERRGYQVIYLPPNEWYDLPAGTDIVLSLLAEESRMLDPLRLPSTVQAVAWVRNNTERWATSPLLPAYDAVLCSSERTRQRVVRAYHGPIGVLRIGVDPNLFSPPDEEGGRSGVVTTVNQWGVSPRATYRALAASRIDFPLAIFGVQMGLPRQLEGFTHGPVSYFGLPSAYQRGKIVLDDQQEVNATFGNVNSRIYEALAAGALPITNTRFGLDEVGLEDVPSAVEPEQLHSTVRELLDDEERRRSLVEQLRSEVLASHTYDARAESLASFLEREDLPGSAPDTRAPIVGFMPDYTITNPFQNLLYEEVRQRGIVTTPVRNPFDLATLPSVQGRDTVFHLHWTATILGGSKNEPEARGRVRSFLEGLDLVHEHGGKVIWTVHNTLPHECHYPEAEIALRRGIAERADRIHVMCRETLDAVAPHYELPAEKVAVIEHGSFIDVYPDIVSREVARRELDLAVDETVLLFLGQIRPYKGIERLLDAFVEACRGRAPLRLLVAGAPGKFEGVNELLQRIRSTPRVISRLVEIPDDDLQVYLRASDVMVLPHEQVLNSGAALLALSYGLPLIAPRTGCLRTLPDDVGRTFDGAEELADALRNAHELATDEHRTAAYQRAVRHTYLDMAEQFADLLQDLGIEGRPSAAGRVVPG